MTKRMPAAIVTLHNTRDLLDAGEDVRAAVVTALGRAARVVVHTAADVARLDALGLTERTALLPHPAASPARPRVRELPLDAAPTIGCTGFFLPDKGIGELIAAVGLIRETWPSCRLRLVNAEYDDLISANEIATCRDLSERLKVPVEWETSFVTLERQQSLLAGCDLVVLPYQRSKESSSAALRSALASGIPVAVTPLPLFDEAADAVFRLGGLDSAAIASGVATLLASASRRASLNSTARTWLADRALPDIARRLHGMIHGLATQRRLGLPMDGAIWDQRSSSG